MKYLRIIGLGFLIMTTAVADARTYHTGPRGGCYYYNSNTNKIYVEHYKCNNNYKDPAPISRTKKYAPAKTNKSYTIQNPVYTTLTPESTTKETKARDTIPEMTAKQKQKYTQAQWETLQSHKLMTKEHNKRATKHRATLLSRYNNRSNKTISLKQESTTNRSNRISRYGRYKKRPTLQRVHPTAVRSHKQAQNTKYTSNTLNTIPNTYTAKVVRIIDGDTFEATVGGKLHKIRLMGIDTPESKKKGTPVECYAKEAEQKLTELIDNKTITLETEGIPYGMYGRIIAYAEVDGIDIGKTLIKEGYAEVYTKSPFERMDEYRAAEEEARNKDKGLWGETCN